MRGSILALLLVGVLAAPAAPAHADDPVAFCEGVAAQQAMPLLAQAYQLTPNGYGASGWGPIVGPFNAGPAGAAALFGPPGLVAAYGPLGPGLTSTRLGPIVLPQRPPGAALAPIAAAAAAGLPTAIFPPGRSLPAGGLPQIDPTGAAATPSPNTDVQIRLATLTQHELGNLLSRYTTSAAYQVDLSFFVSAAAAQALEMYNQVLASCKDERIGPLGPLGAALGAGAGADAAAPQPPGAGNAPVPGTGAGNAPMPGAGAGSGSSTSAR